jgi:hypothetical protein
MVMILLIAYSLFGFSAYSAIDYFIFLIPLAKPAKQEQQNLKQEIK